MDTQEHKFYFSHGRSNFSIACGWPQINDSPDCPRATLFLNDVGVGGLDDQNTFCVHSLHGEMELVQQLSKTLSLVMFATIIIVTQGEKGERDSTRKHFCHQNDIELLSDKAHCGCTNTLLSDTNIPGGCRITFALPSQVVMRSDCEL